MNKYTVVILKDGETTRLECATLQEAKSVRQTFVNYGCQEIVIEKIKENDMNHYDIYEVVGMAVRSIGKPCVYIDNNLDFDNDEQDNEVWNSVVKELIRLYSPNDTYTGKYIDIVSTALNSGLIAFDTEAEQKEFFSIFVRKEFFYGSGINAVAFDKDGNVMEDNT